MPPVNIEEVVCSLDCLVDGRISRLHAGPLAQVELKHLDLLLDDASLRQEQKRAVCEIRNMLNSISILGDDVLAQVFWFCARMDNFCGPRFIISPFSHVCRQWRRVALENPRVWGRLEGHAPKLALEQLRRARNAPLVVERLYVSSEHKTKTSEFIAAVTQKHTQFEELHLCGDHDELSDFLARLTNPMPLLSRLNLDDDGPNPDQGLCELRCPALENFACPKLRHLRLNNASIPWDSRCLEDLTSFRLNTYNYALPSSENLIAMFECCARMPHLEYFELGIGDDDDVLEDSERADEFFEWAQFASFVDSAERITLGSVSTLRLRSLSNVMDPILRYLVLPNLRSLEVKIEFCQNVPRAFAAFNIIHRQCCTVFPATLKFLKFSCGGYMGLGVQFSDRSSSGSSHTSPGSNYSIELWDEGAELFFNIANPLLASLQSVRECQLWRLFAGTIIIYICNIIVNLPHLETLEMTGDSSMQVLHMLETMQWSLPDTEWAFPSLTTFRFVDVFYGDKLLDNLRCLARTLKNMKDAGRSVKAVLCGSSHLDETLRAVAEEFGLRESDLYTTEPKKYR